MTDKPAHPLTLRLPLPATLQDQAIGSVQAVGQRGVWTPSGLDAGMIVECSNILERDFDVVPYTSRDMVVAVMVGVARFLERQAGETL